VALQDWFEATGKLWRDRHDAISLAEKTTDTLVICSASHLRWINKIASHEKIMTSAKTQ
jgi:hypothetical protein